MSSGDASRDPPSTEPFLWPAGDRGCLLVHGFTSTPYEMRFLGERLHAAGYSVCGVRLAGHATHIDELEGCRWQDWARSVDEGLAALAAHSSTVAAIGLSLGSLLVLNLAHAQARSIAALVLLAPALLFTNPWPARLGRGAARLLPIVPPRWRRVGKGGSDIADPVARAIHPGYGHLPLRALTQMVALQRHVRPLLSTVHQPAMAAHGALDRTTPLANLTLLERELPNLRETLLLPASGHVLTVDVEKERLAAAVVGFLARALDGVARREQT